MTQQMIKYPSIPAFKDINKHIKSWCNYHNKQTKPTLLFVGTVKGHGSNFSCVRPVSGSAQDIYAQSRERVITPTSDNAGSCMFMEGKRDLINQIMDAAVSLRPGCSGFVQIYGEWFGQGIHKKVGLNNFEKSWNIFGIRISEDAACTEWFRPDEIGAVYNCVPNLFDNRIYHKNMFDTFFVTVNFNDVTDSVKLMEELTLKVEEDCPITRKLMPEGDVCRIGEGIVWEAVSANDPDLDIRGMFLKSKGEKHAKVVHTGEAKVKIAISEEKVASIEEFVSKAVTEGRLMQGITHLKENNLDPTDATNIGAYIRWIMLDVTKECTGMAAESGLTFKELNGPIAQKARAFIVNYSDEEE